MLNTFLVMVGGAIGSAARYHLGRLCTSLFGPAWPWGTLAANVSGGLVMGLFAGWLATRTQLDGPGLGEPLRLLFAVGLLGGFTTFSSFSLETMLMFERGEIASAAAYIGASVAASIGALALGLVMVRGVTA